VLRLRHCRTLTKSRIAPVRGELRKFLGQQQSPARNPLRLGGHVVCTMFRQGLMCMVLGGLVVIAVAVGAGQAVLLAGVVVAVGRRGASNAMV